MRLFRDIGWGVRGAAIFAAAYSVWVLVLMLLHRSVTLSLDTHASVNGFAVIAFYALGAVCVGSIIGVLRPLLRRPVGAAVVGVIAGVPVEIGVLVLVRGFSHWTRIEIYSILTFAIVMGIPCGLVLWNIFSDGPAEPAAKSTTIGQGR